MMPLMNFVGNFGYVVVCVVGAALALDGQIELVIVAFMMYVRLFTQPLAQFARPSGGRVARGGRRTRVRLP